MSYILEALKKAQAERQLGSSPTIHAPTLQAAAGASQGGKFGKPLIVALVAMGVVIAVLLAMVLRSHAPATPSVASAQPGPVAAMPAPVQPAAVAAAPAQPAAVAAAPAAAQPTVVAAAPAPTQPTPLPAPVADLPPSVANLAKASAPEQPAPASTPVKPAVSEDPVANLRDLPEPIQRAIPQITVGGYIYSKNPADRVLLIDKVLRHEGDEVAPGLVLEKLQAKEAIFGFKGYRYRVPY